MSFGRGMVVCLALGCAALPAGAGPNAAAITGNIGKAAHDDQEAGRWLDGSADGAAGAGDSEKFRRASLLHLGAAGALRTAHTLALVGPEPSAVGFYDATVNAHVLVNARLERHLAAAKDTWTPELVKRRHERLADALRVISDDRGRPWRLP